jgi:hypothetical protein
MRQYVALTSGAKFAGAKRAVTFLQHCILYITSYQSRAAAHNLHEYNPGNACDNMSH